MAAGIIGALTAAPAVIEGITNIIGRFIPDPGQQAQAAIEMQKLVADREAAVAQSAAEDRQGPGRDQHGRGAEPIVVRWRVAVVRQLGLWRRPDLYVALLQPLLAWLIGIVNAAFSIGIPMPPAPPSEVLMTVLTGMLGIAGLRS